MGELKRTGPKNSLWYEKVALKHMTKAQFSQAKDDFLAAKEYPDRSAQVLEGLAENHRKHNHRRTAVDEMVVVIDSYRNRESLLTPAEGQSELCEFENAIYHIRKAIRIDRNGYHSHHGLARILVKFDRAPG